MVMVALVIPTISLLSRIRSVQLYCTNIQDLFGFYLTSIFKRAHQQTHHLVKPRLWLTMIGLMMVIIIMNTHLDAQDKLINGFIN